MIYLEEYLEHICKEYLSSLKPVDQIYFSIYKQTAKGMGLTDRQYNLVLQKVKEYVDVADNVATKIPLRQIDRSKYITVVPHAEMVGPNSVYESHKSNWQWIKIRFPFSKKDIVLIEKIINNIERTKYSHTKGSHEHYFALTPLNAFYVVSAFMNRSFDIDKELIDLYNNVNVIMENKNQYILFSEENNLYNVSDEIKQYVDDVSNGYDRRLIVADRSLRFSYKSDFEIYSDNLIDKIAGRNEVEYLANPAVYNQENITKALSSLNRFPVVVLIDNDNNAYNQLIEWHNAFSNYVDNSLQAVLFREESTAPTAEINDYIHVNKLNNWVDNNTKIVYIKKNKLPKILIDKFKPITAVSKTSLRSSSNVSCYINFNCDLILYNDETSSMIGKYSRQYGFM